jgi:hypothetical protein
MVLCSTQIARISGLALNDKASPLLPTLRRSPCSGMLVIWWLSFMESSLFVHTGSLALQFACMIPIPEVEISIARLPCACCKKSRQEFEETTGIAFTVTIIPNLGNMLETRDQNEVNGYEKPPFTKSPRKLSSPQSLHYCLSGALHRQP